MAVEAEALEEVKVDLAETKVAVEVTSNAENAAISHHVETMAILANVNLTVNRQKEVVDHSKRNHMVVIKAIRLQEKTKQVGFEWENTSQVMDKVNEELEEWKSAVQSKDKEAIEDELGDVFFSLINYARFEQIDPEAALEKVNQKFKKRFEYIEVNAPKPLEEMKLEEMEALWQAAKINLRK